MSERKVLNKYYPPDFDPARLPKAVKIKDKQENIRMMLPMNIYCDTCGNFLHIGTKYNMRKETSAEKYLGIEILRFYFKCPRCSEELTMKTDPKTNNYVMEHNATRCYEPWRDMEQAIAQMKSERLKEEEGDAMKCLENRTNDSKNEMDVLDALNAMRESNKKLARPDFDKLIEMVRGKVEIKVEDLSEEQKSNLQSFKQRRIKDQISLINEYEQNSEKTKESITENSDNKNLKDLENSEIPPQTEVEIQINHKRIKEEKPLASASSMEKPFGLGNMKIKAKTKTNLNLNLKNNIKPTSFPKETETTNTVSKLFGFDQFDSVSD